MTNLFLTYLGISATVGVVVLLILLASPFINRRYAAKWKYFIWIFLAIRLLIPVSGMYHAKNQAPAMGDPAQSNGTMVYEPADVPEVRPRRFIVEIPVGTAGQPAPATDTTAGKKNPTLLDVIIAAWIIGAVVFVSVPLISCLHYKYRITHSGRRVTGGSAYDTLQQAKSRLKIRRKVSLMRFNQAASPMIIGFIRPVMVLPCDEYSEEELGFIVRHELIHLRRGDVYVKLLCVIANALHWFNPLIWIMRREMAVDMELSCDEGVIKGAGFDVKKAYTETLMSSLRRQSSKKSSLTTQFYGGKGTMKKRFSNILGKGGKKNGIAVLIIAVVLATLLGVLVGCTQKAPADDGLGESLADLPDTDSANGEPDVHIDNGASALSDDEMNRLIAEYLRFERYAVYGCMSFTSNDQDSGVWIGDTFVPEIELDGSYLPSSEEGLTTWQEWLDFLNGLFTPETTEEKLKELTGEGKRYMNVDGKLYVLPGGDMGWPYKSPAQAGYKTDGSEGVIEFWREDISEGSEGTYRMTVFRLKLTNSGWRIQTVESYDTYSAIEGYQPILDKPEALDEAAPTTTTTEPAQPVTEATTNAENNEPDVNIAELANEILENLERDYRTTVDILTMHMTEPINLVEGVDQLGNLRDIDGVTYVPMLEDYDTIDEIMEVFRRVYTEEKCDTLYSHYLDTESTGFMKEVDGKLYAMAIGEQGHSFFEQPITSAGQISETEILAKTTVKYDFGDVPYEITLKYENGEWKIDKLVEYMSEEGREMSY